MVAVAVLFALSIVAATGSCTVVPSVTCTKRSVKELKSLPVIDTVISRFVIIVSK